MWSLNMWMPLVSPEPKQQFNKEDKKRFAFLSGVLLLPACLLFLFSAFVGLVDNPFLTELTATLCIPSQSLSFHILPPPFHPRYDEAIAAFIMLGIHQTSLVVTARIEGNYSRSAQENPKKTMGS